MIPAHCFAISGLFLRESVWHRLRFEFRSFECIDHLRDEDIDLEAFLLIAAERIERQIGTVVMIGHSFGGYLAQAIYGRLSLAKQRDVIMVLISTLPYDSATSAVEKYCESGETALINIVRARWDKGTVELVDANRFSAMLGIESIPGKLIANREPLSLVMDRVGGTNASDFVKTWFVVQEGDEFATPAGQIAVARALNAKLLVVSGGHLGAFSDAKWLTSIVDESAL